MLPGEARREDCTGRKLFFSEVGRQQIKSKSENREIKGDRGGWLAQSAKRATLDLGGASSSPTLGVEFS